MLTPTYDLVQSVTCTDGCSDHNLLEVTLSFRNHVKCPAFKVIFNYGTPKYVSINNELNKFFDERLWISDSRRSEKWELIRNKLNELVDVLVRTVRTVSGGCHHCYSKRVYRIKKRKQHRRKIKQTSNWHGRGTATCSQITIKHNGYLK